MSETMQKEREESSSTEADRVEPERQRAFSLDEEANSSGRQGCDNDHHSGASGTTYDVVVGEVYGTYTESTTADLFSDDPAHVRVTGIDSEYPTIESWCPSCLQANGVDVEPDATRQWTERVQASPWITASNLASFMIGMITLWVLVFWILP